MRLWRCKVGCIGTIEYFDRQLVGEREFRGLGILIVGDAMPKTTFEDLLESFLLERRSMGIVIVVDLIPQLSETLETRLWRR